MLYVGNLAFRSQVLRVHHTPKTGSASPSPRRSEGRVGIRCPSCRGTHALDRRARRGGRQCAGLRRNAGVKMPLRAKLRWRPPIQSKSVMHEYISQPSRGPSSLGHASVLPLSCPGGTIGTQIAKNVFFFLQSLFENVLRFRAIPGSTNQIFTKISSKI